MSKKTMKMLEVKEKVGERLEDWLWRMRWQEKKSVQWIAQTAGVSYGTIRNWLDLYGITRRSFKEVWADPDFKKRMGQRIKQGWKEKLADPYFRKYHSQQRSQRAKEMWRDPSILTSHQPRLAGFHVAKLAVIMLGVILIGGFAMNPANADSIQDPLEKSPRHHEWVKITAENGHVVSAFLAFPEIKDKATSVVVIHENRGLTDWVKWVGDELAKHGFVAICPDFLSGTGPNGGGTDSFPSSDAARSGIYELDPDQITTDLKAVKDYVRNLPSTTDKVAVAGFCWGGGQTFRFATNDDSITAAFVFYGRPPEKADVGRIACPVYGFYGESDNRINSTIEETQKAMTAVGKIYEPVIYSGVGHAFLRRGMDEGDSEVAKSATRDAWERLMKLLNEL